MKQKVKISDIFTRVFMWLYAFIVVLPILWVIITSLKTNQEFVQNPWGLFSSPQFINYANAWGKVKFNIYALNSVVLTVIAVLLSTVLACCAAYVLVRMRFFGASGLLSFFIAGLYIPIVLILPSEFEMLSRMNLIDSHLGLCLVYIAFCLPYSILVMSGFFKSIPKELEDAAYIDGCSRFKTFWKIIMPVSKNGIITMAIFNFLWVWNDFVIALTLIISDEKRTLPVGLIVLMSTFKLKADWVTLFAGINMVMLPTVIVYIIFQKSLQEGLSGGAVKG